MTKSDNPYHEHLLHWIWENLHLKVETLHTIDGQKVGICRPGTHNHTDGPDFLNAELSMGSMKWFGDVELHWSEHDWYSHSHHRNPRFNRVILHVVYHKPRKNVVREDGTGVPTLHLKSYLSQPLQVFLDRYHRPGTLPCKEHLEYISASAFREQIKIAHKAYFEQKVNDLLNFYESSLPPSEAWKKMFSTGLSDGLGIAHNREPMRRLSLDIYPALSASNNVEDFKQEAIFTSGLVPDQHSPYAWNRKSCRPSNRPELRVRQAAEMLWFINNRSVEGWINKPELSWTRLLEQITTAPGLGRQRGAILYGTVFLPSVFILGNIFGMETLRSFAYEHWEEHRVRLPRSLLTDFDSLAVPSGYYRNKLGSIYQLRHYCRSGNCQSCKVFKSVINS